MILRKSQPDENLPAQLILDFKKLQSIIHETDLKIANFHYETKKEKDREKEMKLHSQVTRDENTTLMAHAKNKICENDKVN